MKWNSWIREVEFVNSWSWIREVEFVNSWSWIREFVKWNSWSWIREFVKLNSWIREVEFVNSWRWIREVEFVKLKSWIREVEFVNSWSWNREFVKLKPWINVVEMTLPVFRRLDICCRFIATLYLVENYYDFLFAFPARKATSEIRVYSERKVSLKRRTFFWREVKQFRQWVDDFFVLGRPLFRREEALISVTESSYIALRYVFSLDNNFLNPSVMAHTLSCANQYNVLLQFMLG